MTVHQDRTFEDLRNTVHEYFRILRRRWRPALLGLTLVGTVAFWISQYLPREYGTATLFERRDDVVLRNLVRSNSPYNFGQIKSSLILDMTGSRALAEAAIVIGLLPPDFLQSKDALSNEEQRRLDHALAKYNLRATVRQVESNPNLDTIELRCTANDPTIASKFVVALRDGYIQRTRAQITDVLGNSQTFLVNEINRLDNQIAEANRKLQEQCADFRGVDPTNPAAAAVRLEAFETEAERLRQRLAELDAQIATREKFLTSEMLNESSAVYAVPNAASSAAPPVLPETNSKLDQAIRQVEQEITDSILLHRMTNEHPTVKTLQRKLDNLLAAREAARAATTLAEPGDAPESSSTDESAETPVPQPDLPTARQRLAQQDPVMAGHRLRVELELDALRAQAEVARKHLEEADSRKEKFSALYTRLVDSGDESRRVEEQIEQDKTTASVWRQHLAQLERILAAENEERGTQFVLLEEPKQSPRAIKPQASAIFAVCLGCGLAAAALLIALCELTDRSFRTASQVTRTLGLPVLECVTVINTPKIRRRRMVARMIWTPALSVLLCAFLVSALLAYASLEHPQLHTQAMSKIDNVLNALGAPSMSVGGASQDEGG